MLIVCWRSSLAAERSGKGAIDGTGNCTDISSWRARSGMDGRCAQVWSRAGTRSAFSSRLICDAFSGAMAVACGTVTVRPTFFAGEPWDHDYRNWARRCGDVVTLTLASF